MTPVPVHVRLELHSDGEALWGRATSDQASREFHGWIGLIGAIEALCSGTENTPQANEEAGIS